MKSKKVALVTAALLAMAACSDSPPSTADAGGCFIAFNPAFDGFRSWPSYSYVADTAVAGNFHTSGPRTEYIAQAPPHGSSEFPVGTIIVKEIVGVDSTTHHIYALVKRGCDFNAAGAKNWEFMELNEVAGGATVRWRGSSPPAGDTYGGDPTSCNTCHAACTDNDDVCSTHIRLSSY